MDACAELTENPDVSGQGLVAATLSAATQEQLSRNGCY